MASIHSVLPMFYEAVYSSLSLQQINTPFVAIAKRQVMQQVMLHTMRTNESLELNKKHYATGVKPLVVKGVICINLYSQPDYRQSGDEDVLVPTDQFDTCQRVMQEFGMQTTEDESIYLQHTKFHTGKGEVHYILNSISIYSFRSQMHMGI